MENYTADIPALDPLASGVNDSPARPILAGLPLNVDDIAAAKNQYTKRKHFHKANYATQNELSAAKRRHIQVEMEHATAGAIGPAWATGLQAALDNLTQVTNDTNARLQALARTVNDPNTGLGAVAGAVVITNTHLLGLTGSKKSTATWIVALFVPFKIVSPIYHPDAVPNWSPGSYREVLYCSEEEADNFIRFYNIVFQGDPTLESKRLHIKNFLGISI